MKRHYRMIFVVLAVTAAMSSLSAGAETVTGVLVGEDCALHGELCPVDRLDAHIQHEEDFVVVTQEGEIYMLPNLSRDVKLRHVLETVVVEGSMAAGFNAVEVEALKVRGDDGLRTVWSQAMHDEELAERCRQAKARFAKAGDSYYERPAAWREVRKFCTGGR